jgi:hypothetical protein
MRNLQLLLILLLFASCKKETTSTSSPRLVFRFVFDSTQERLNNIGNPAVLPSTHRAQSPIFNSMSAHYIELAPDKFTPLGSGSVLYKATETSLGGNLAIDFDKSTFAHNGEVFFSTPLENLRPGTYEWLRVSLAYQNYDIKVKYGANIYTGTVASFVGFNTYIRSFTIKSTSKTLNANRRQGYWAFEGPFGYNIDGLAPENATTVPNPIFNTSPIPAGSCVVTGAFVSDKTISPLIITGKETKDIVVEVNLSTNRSFEWKETVIDGFYEPAVGDSVVDMGIRGMIPSWH